MPSMYAMQVRADSQHEIIDAATNHFDTLEEMLDYIRRYFEAYIGEDKNVAFNIMPNGYMAFDLHDDLNRANREQYVEERIVRSDINFKDEN